jgi:NDP-sugar pyrophosphorylase family protein
MSDHSLNLASQKMVAAAILSAGRGTRMGPLSERLPKPLLPLCGPALIEWSLASLGACSIERVGVNTHHLSERLKRALSSHALIWSDEEVLQGTGGGARDIWRALERSGGPLESLVILNGDAWFDFSLEPLLQAHLNDPTREATLCVRETSYDDPFGRVGISASGEVVRIAEVEGPRAHEETRVGAFLGAQVVKRSLLEATPEGPCDLFRSAYRARLAQGARVCAHLAPDTHLWADVGTPERYLDLHQTLLERYARGELSERIARLLPPLTLKRSRSGGLIALMEGARCDEGAQVTRSAWLYPLARLHAGVELQSAVLLPSSSSRSIGLNEAPGVALMGIGQEDRFIEASGDLRAGAVGASR